MQALLNLIELICFTIGGFCVFKLAGTQYAAYLANGFSLKDLRPFALETFPLKNKQNSEYLKKLRQFFVNAPIAQIASEVDYLRAQVNLSFCLFCITWAACWFFGNPYPFFAIGLAVLSCALLFLNAKDQHDSFVKSVGRELPFALDFMGLCFSAGLDMTRSMALLAKGTSPLSQEISRILNASLLGMSRTEALLAFQERVPLANVRQFVMTLIQGAKQGSNIGQTLEQLASAMHTERFQKAEEKAGKISVRMMIPMMVCIMPAVLIMLLGPMLLSYVYANK